MNRVTNKLPKRRFMNKRVLLLAGSLIMFPISQAHATSMGPTEFNTDRPGSDLRDFALPAANPTICLNDCAADAACFAWNYEPAGATFAQPHCFLKSGAPQAVLHNSLMSGVKVRP
jgi:hypothetical protein